MNEIDLRPRSATEIVDAAFQLFRRNPTQLIVASALVYVPWLVVRLVFDIGITDPMMGANKAYVLIAGTMVLYAVVGGVVSILASDIYLGNAPDLAAAFRTTGSHVIGLIVAGVIRSLLIAIGMVFLVAPGLYALGRYFAVTQAIVLEDKGVGGAMSRSATLSADLKLHIIGTIALIGLVSIAISVGIGVLASASQSKVIVNVISTAVSVIIYPLFGMTETLLYYDARIRKEGFDVEFLAHTDASMPASESPAT
jgi:hypothetical protein